MSSHVGRGINGEAELAFVQSKAGAPLSPARDWDSYDTSTLATARQTFPYQRGDVIVVDDGMDYLHNRRMLNEALVRYVCPVFNRHGDVIVKLNCCTRKKDGSFSATWRWVYEGHVQRGFELREKIRNGLERIAGYGAQTPGARLVAK